ncbi:hypothetical protein [Streptomyces graminofaciens]|nr:hypothetical protein [Streptomyces graminofaciens]
MRRPYRVIAQVVGAAVLVGAAACTVGDGGGGGDVDTGTGTGMGTEKGRGAGTASPAAPRPSTPAAPPTTPALTDDGARKALLRVKDLGGTWADTQGAATWRDGLLKGRTDRPECQQLLDTFYAEDLLGEPTGGTAVTGFDDDEYGAQLRYQVGAYEPRDVDARLEKVRQLLGSCGEFTITSVRGAEYAAQVEPVELPGSLGDARQGLRLIVSGFDVDGEEGALTLDLATVRVGDNAALLTHGGLYGIDDSTTREAARVGAKRLKEAVTSASRRASGSPSGSPSVPASPPPSAVE